MQKECVYVCQGHMVAKGTYTELQQSGVDFTSLLKKEEEEEQHQPPQDILGRSRTLSQNSALSQTSSVHSAKDGDQLPVSILTLLSLPWLPTCLCSEWNQMFCIQPLRTEPYSVYSVYSDACSLITPMSPSPVTPSSHLCSSHFALYK